MFCENNKSGVGHDQSMVKILHTIKELSSIVVTFVILLILLTNFVTMFYSAWYIIPFIGDKYFAIPFYILVPVPLLFAIVRGLAAYGWYLFLVAAITTSVTLLMVRGFPKYLRKLKSSPLSYETNSVQEYAEIFSMVLFLDILVVFIMRMFSVKTPSIGIENTPLYFQMLSLLHASVYEEIVTRLAFIGIPVFIWRLLRRNKYGDNVKFWHIFGGTNRFETPEITFILISAAIFGIAHTPAWGWWKFVPTFIAGIAMGYLYVKYGMHMSILMHFTTDFMTIPMAFDSRLYLIYSVLLIVVVVLGFIFTISYSIKILQHFSMVGKNRGKRANKGMPVAPWIDIKCPNCGSQKFVYLGNGKLQCVKCGTIIDEYSEQSHQLDDEGSHLSPPP